MKSNDGSDILASPKDETFSQPETSSTSNTIHEKLRKLGILAHGMADREMISCDSKLYLSGFLRYDDATVFVILIEGQESSS
jgi:hypothetical protein